MEKDNWVILTFETSKGEKVIDDFIRNLQAPTNAKIIHIVNLLKQYGNKLGMPHSKSLGSGLYELRIRGKEEIRIFYCFKAKKIIFLLHTFKKKTQTTPNKEIALALQRMKSLE